MLNSYKDVQHWFPALEPQDPAAPRETADPDLEHTLSQGGAGRYPHYIQETEPEPFDVPFGGTGTRRAEFVGGWSDWVAGDHAPGPDDDYPVRNAELVQFPWDEEAQAPARRPRRSRADDAEDAAFEPRERSPRNESDRADADSRTRRTESRPGPLDDDDWPGNSADWLDDWPEPTGGGRAESGRRSWFPRRRANRPKSGPGAATAPRGRRQQAGPGSLRVALVLGVAVLLLAAAAMFAVYLLQTRGGAARSAHAANSARPVISEVRLTGATTGTVLSCPTEHIGSVVRGAGPGGTDSGPDAIMWFQHAYYVDRSAVRALEVVAPDAGLPPAEVIQRGIDSVPAGTAYCVRVAPSGDSRYSVEVTEQRPGGAPATYGRQTVTTKVVGGRTLITGITAG
ncbi:hypothetical protein [Nocardia macrotermitis]|uniref:DUF8176 domain-containing protein n=1 Tax=Nocardia macrotermitis TaxID=2585198 RepID=A0A7K0D822_9NOCA|nr:hypothetical protein [Nocardia macrotermitis]MQY21906.1 hypothetical protein [Nocardia macrotermitis]